MQKTFFFIAALSVFSALKAQTSIELWSDDFNDGDVSDWHLLDLDSDDNGWDITGLFQDDGTYDNSTKKVLSILNYDLAKGSSINYKRNDWAISPVISLKVEGTENFYYGGTVKIIINGQGIQTNCKIKVLASTNPDYEDVEGSFTYLTTIDVLNPNKVTVTPTQFKDYEIDISDFIKDEKELSIALFIVYDVYDLGVEIDAISVEATDVVKLSTTEVEKEAPKVQIAQNPVQEVLALQLDTRFNESATKLSIYNAAGALVKTVKYRSKGIDVSTLAAGIYYIVAEDEKIQAKEKFIKR